MTATSTIFKYINRDEVTHLVLFQNIIRELRRERPDLFTPELEEKITDMIRQGTENEIAWGQYITDDKILLHWQMLVPFHQLSSWHISGVDDDLWSIYDVNEFSRAYLNTVALLVSLPW